jgi:hypothetical protein
MNYRFDLDEWLPRLPLEPRNGRFSGQVIASPCDICNNEHLRWAAYDQFAWGPAVPVDIFIMAEGEPENRHATKIGGLPYRQAGMDWPTSLDGTPMSFLAQIDFTDSTDLVGELPGDVLLVFTPDTESCDIETVHFEWQPLGLSDLISGNALPEQVFCHDPCYGHLCRTVSYPEARRNPELAATKYPMCGGREIWSSHHLLQYQATQIGQAPFFIQHGDRDLPGQLLCAISSVQPDQHERYPWVNRPEPLMPKDQWRYDNKYLMMGDVGCIYISIDGVGNLHHTMSCY